MRNTRQRRGDWGEEVARGYLQTKGYTILGANVRSPFGEIDLVCCQASELVIVEVKTRYSTVYGYPEEAVTVSKQHKLRRLAQWYWNTHRQYRTVRIDVIAILVNGDGVSHIEHIPNAV